MPQPRKLPLPRSTPLPILLDDWILYGQAAGLSYKTLDNRRFSVDKLIKHLSKDICIADVEQRMILEWIVTLRGTSKPASVTTHVINVKLFFKWCVEQGEIHISPMADIKAPKPTYDERRIMDDGDIAKILKTCNSRDFYDVRDKAIISLLLDGGMRVGELCRIATEDMDIKAGDVLIRKAKSGTGRLVPFGLGANNAIRAYLRVRAVHPFAHYDQLWLGKFGSMTATGIRQMLDKRTQLAGVPHMFPHLFRHKMIDSMLDMGIQEGDVMQYSGHRDRTMLDRYARAGKQRRAKKNYRSPLDNLDK